MSLTININLPDIDSTGRGGVSRAALDAHMDALGFNRVGLSPAATKAVEALAVAEQRFDSAVERASEQNVDTAPVPTTVIPRERGKPAPGRSRRTQAEIAEDEAADKADEASGTQQSISSGEERVGPEDDAETAAQDAADEAAEAAASKGDDPAPTVDDLRNIMGAYAEKHGMAKTQERGIEIFNATLGAAPKGEDGWKVSLVVKEGRIPEALVGWRKALAEDKAG